MYKLVKWAFEMGVKYERRRVRMLIKGHQKDKPEPHPNRADNDAKETYLRQMDVWQGVNDTLHQLIMPQLQGFEERPIYRSDLDE